MDEEDSIFRSDPERLKRLIDLGLDADDPNPRDDQDLTSPSFGDSRLTTGSQIGHFRIERELGRGGAGVVYLAHDSKLNRQVAIKSLPPDLIEDEEARSRFTREARALASVNHPNIATIHDVLEEDGRRHYIILEYIPGKTLAEHISRGPLKLKEALTIGVQVAEAVAAAHENGIVHRDLKPGNIKITPDGKVKVLDFGLAKAVEGKFLDTHSTLTLPGRIVGTPAYMSPEQASGQKVDKRSDVWALGCCLFEMLTACRPFRGETMTDLMATVLTVDPDWSLLPAETPHEVVTLLQRCLEKKSDHRLQSTLDLAFVLRDIGTSPISSTLRAGERQTRHRWRFTQVLPWALTGLTVIVSLFAIVYSRRPSTGSATGVNSTPRKIELYLPGPVGLDSPDEEITNMAIAPDGRKFVFINTDGLWLRWLDRVSPPALLVPGTGIRGPFWSPQSIEIAYLLGPILYRLAITGGQPKLICRAPEGPAPGGADPGPCLP